MTQGATVEKTLRLSPRARQVERGRTSQPADRGLHRAAVPKGTHTGLPASPLTPAARPSRRSAWGGLARTGHWRRTGTLECNRTTTPPQSSNKQEDSYPEKRRVGKDRGSNSS